MKKKFIFIYSFFSMILFLIFNGVTVYLLKYIFIPNISFLNIIFNIKQFIGDVKLTGKIFAVFFLFYLFIFPYIAMKLLYASLKKHYNKNISSENNIDNNDTDAKENEHQGDIIDANTILK